MQIGKEKLDILVISTEQGFPIEKFSFNVSQPRKNMTEKCTRYWDMSFCTFTF
jgi:hypothetical protein